MNSFIENVNYVAGLDNLYGSRIELYKNNLSLKNVQHDIELKFSYYSNYDKKIHSIVHSEPGVLVGGIDDTLLSFKTLVESSITGSEFTCTVSFVINNISMVNINITSNSDMYKAYELEMKIVTAGAVIYDVFGEVKDSLKILPSLAMITASDIDAMEKVYEIKEDVTTVSENIANVETVSDSIANVNTVGISISNVNMVGEDITNVNTVSTHISNVDTVSQSITNVNTVGSNIVDVGVASTNIASIKTVANAKNLSDIIRVADDLNSLDVNGIADITIVANDLVLGVDSNIITVSESIDNVNITGNDIDNVNTVGINITDIGTVSTNIANVNITATDIVSINSVSSSIADVNTLSDGIANVNTVSDSITNVNTVASNIVGLNSIVSNMPEILLADYNAAIATTKALESSYSRNQAETFAQEASASALSVDASNIVHRTGNETIDGVKTFSSNIVGNINGNAGTASKLQTARTISLSGDASGSASFDGSADTTITIAVADDSHNHAFANLTGKPTTLSGYGITDADTSAQVTTKINSAVAALVNASPTTLDTLNELAAALGDDPNFATTTANNIAAKVAKVTSTDNAIVRFDGVTGDVQNSNVIIDDAGNITYLPNKYISFGGTSNSYLFGDYAGSIEMYGGNNIRLVTAGAERVRIDSAGNIGIGATPSAWTRSRVLQLGVYSSIHESNDSGAAFIGSNFYRSGQNINNYIISGWGATLYEQNGGTHNWKTAPSGTAGNPITWTNAMTLGDNGNLLVGTTTDNGVDKLQVNGSISSGAIQVISNGDLNNYKTRTQVIGTFPSGFISNIPIDDHGYLEVIVYSSNSYVMQRFTTLGVIAAPGRIFVRCLVNGVWWSDWAEK